MINELYKKLREQEYKPGDAYPEKTKREKKGLPDAPFDRTPRGMWIYRMFLHKDRGEINKALVLAAALRYVFFGETSFTHDSLTQYGYGEEDVEDLSNIEFLIVGPGSRVDDIWDDRNAVRVCLDYWVEQGILSKTSRGDGWYNYGFVSGETKEKAKEYLKNDEYFVIFLPEMLRE